MAKPYKKIADRHAGERNTARPEAPDPKTLKSFKPMVATLCIAGLLSLALLWFLYFAYEGHFQAWHILTLFGIVIVAIIAWVFYFNMRVKFNYERDPKHKAKLGSGNRKNRRKSQ